MRLLKWFFIITVLFIFSVSGYDSAEASKDRVIIEGGTLSESRTIVPMRAIFEELGATVQWNSADRTVTAYKDMITVTLKIGSKQSFVNENAISIDVPAQIVKGKTYVPLRFVSDALGADVHWDKNLRTVTIEAGEKTLIVLVNHRQQKEFSILGIEIGDQESKVMALAGKPVTTYKSEYGFTWNVYHNEFKNYYQVGIKNDTVVALYTNDKLFKTKSQLPVTSTKKDVQFKYGTPSNAINKGTTKYLYESKDQDLFFIDDYYITVFYDSFLDYQISGLQLIRKDIEHMKKGFYGESTEQLRASFEQQLFDLTNAVRVKYGKSPLKWNSEVASVAFKHSHDMAVNNYFAHTNLQGKSPFERITAGGIVYKIAGENLAMGQYSSIFALEGLMNSFGHRQNILSDRFTDVGIGVAYRTNIPYFTQNFITPQEN
ncbi:stalk domain-containing protein [Anaerobacillus sp. MEB173]|uniref:stalk domain-containing protein n=1 Tax=Anaerobacillus sp. MEB173 TaxID=3383345 RepID=UPI003F8E7FAF